MRRTLAATLAAIACLVALPGAAAAQQPLTVFLAKRPGLEIKITVQGHHIVGTSTISKVHCEEDGGSGWGTGTLDEWGKRFPIGPKGGFRRRVEESYEGSGSYFWALNGHVWANRIVGLYSAREELLGEEEWLPACGTKSEDGHSLRFSAHRVSGPPWRP